MILNIMGTSFGFHLGKQSLLPKTVKAHQIQNGRTQKVSWNSLLAQSHNTPL